MSYISYILYPIYECSDADKKICKSKMNLVHNNGQHGSGSHIIQWYFNLIIAGFLQTYFKKNKQNVEYIRITRIEQRKRTWNLEHICWLLRMNFPREICLLGLLMILCRRSLMVDACVHMWISGCGRLNEVATNEKYDSLTGKREEKSDYSCHGVCTVHLMSWYNLWYLPSSANGKIVCIQIHSRRLSHSTVYLWWAIIKWALTESIRACYHILLCENNMREYGR